MSRLDAAIEDCLRAIRAINDTLAALPAPLEELLAEEEKMEEKKVLAEQKEIEERKKFEENTETFSSPSDQTSFDVDLLHNSSFLIGLSSSDHVLGPHETLVLNKPPPIPPTSISLSSGGHGSGSKNKTTHTHVLGKTTTFTLPVMGRLFFHSKRRCTISIPDILVLITVQELYIHVHSVIEARCLDSVSVVNLYWSNLSRSWKPPW